MVVKNQKGSVLITVLFAMTILMILGTAMINIVTTDAMMGSYFKDYTAAYYLSEAGLEKTLIMLKQDPDYTNARWKAFLGKSHSLGDGEYLVNISPTGSNTISIHSTGSVKNAKTSIMAKVKVMVEYIEGEEDPDLNERIVHVDVQSWAYDGPI